MTKGGSKKRKKVKVITDASWALANRSRRSWPHNAIYEILTCGCVDLNQPDTYKGEQVSGFFYVLKNIDITQATLWQLVYRDGYTVTSAAEEVGIGKTTAFDKLNKIHRTKIDGMFAHDIIRSGVESLRNV